MGYSKTTWTDRNVQYPNRYTDELSNVKTFTASPGTVTAAGTKVTASNMNNLETGVEAAHKGTHVYGASSVGTDSYAITFSPAFGAYNTGMTINLKADVDNTGTATLNVDGLGAKTIKKITPAGLADLSNKDIVANGIYTLIYDGTNFILQNRLIPGIYIISDTTLSASAADITFNTFFGEYDELLLDLFNARLTVSASTTNVRAQFNDDTGANYTAGGTASQTYCNIGVVQGSALTDPRAIVQSKIFNLSNIIKNITYAGTEANFTFNNYWHNTSNRITKIKIYPASDSFASGTRAILRGVKWG